MARPRTRKRYQEQLEDRDPNVMWMEFGDGYVVPHGNKYAAVGDRLIVIRDADILLQTRLVRLGKRVGRGQLVVETTPSWQAVTSELDKDPSFLEWFPVWHRRFEELLAGGYLKSEWNDVVLSPRSRDGGFDIAAFKDGKQILDEAKAYKSTLRIKHQVVRAALGLLVEHDAIDQVRVSTTSEFAPHVRADFKRLIPNQLLLRDRFEVLDWLMPADTCANEISG
jgi:hypothetical protein